MFFTKHLTLCLALLLPALSLCAATTPMDEPVLTLEEGRVCRIVNGQPITGREIIDMLLEERWEHHVQLFAEHQLRMEEIQAGKIEVGDKEVDAELQFLLDEYARRIGIDPAGVKLEQIAQPFGGMAVMRQTTRENLCLLRAFQLEKRLKENVHTNDPQFQSLVCERLEKRMAVKPVETDPKKLSSNEGLRIGTRSFARDEVRLFAFEDLRQLTQKELQNKLEILTLERIINSALKARNVELTQADLEFHYSYWCCKIEAEKGVPGRAMLRQQLQSEYGMTPEQYVKSRLGRYDAGISRLAKDKIGLKQLKDEFAAHPERYKRSENLIAHILIRVLDPEGRPYTPDWQAPAGGAANAYAARRREDQFTAAKPKIDALITAARQDFAAAARKYSDDKTSAALDGRLARIGPESIPMPPWDKAVRDAAIKLKPGDISEPVRSDYGWHILKCLEHQEVDFNEASERIYLRLLYNERLRLDAALRQDAKIEDRLKP